MKKRHDIQIIHNIYEHLKEESLESLSKGFIQANSVYSKLAIIKKIISIKLGMELYDEQLICALYLIEGYALEMRTGEGKSLASLVAALCLSQEKKVYIATVNEYLAERDYEKFLPIYDLLGIKVGLSKDSESAEGDEEREQVHLSDVVYTSSSALIFDYLRALMDTREFNLECVLIDEIDFILLDNANSSFSISQDDGGETDPVEVGILHQVNNIIKDFQIGEVSYRVEYMDSEYLDTTGLDLVYNKYTQQTYITKQGEQKIFDGLGIESYIDDILIYKSTVNLVQAYCLYKKGIDYLVVDDKVKTINKASGRAMDNSRLGQGLHNALEVKEGVTVEVMSGKTLTSSYQVFFSKFGHICGMSGTIMTDSKEFKTIYGMDTVRIPLHNPDRCVRHAPIYFRTQEEKYKYVVELVENRHKKGQPVLVVCETESSSNVMYKRLKHLGSKILNNSSLDKEVTIVDQSGQVGSVTISTNMAGRGTDIVISDESNQLGGLFVIALTNYESLRVENQVKGRAGRQGFLGEFQLVTSIDDPIWSGVKLNEYIKLNKVSDDRFYSKKHQRILGKKMKEIQKLNSMRGKNSRKRLYYTHKIIEYIKIYLFSYMHEIDSVNKFVQKVVAKEVYKEDFLKLMGKVFTLGPELYNKKSLEKTMYEVLMKELEGSEEYYVMLVTQLYDEKIRDEWHILHDQLEDFGTTIITSGNYLSTGQTEFVRKSKVIVDSFISVTTVEILLKLLSVSRVTRE